MADTTRRRFHLAMNILLFLLSFGSLFGQETDDAKCTADWYISVEWDLTVRWKGDDRNATMNVTLSTNDTYGRHCTAKETFIVPFDDREVKPTGFCSNAFYQIEMVLTCGRFSKRHTSTATSLPDALKIYEVTTTNTTFEAKWHKPVGPIHGYEILLILETRVVRSNKVNCSSVRCSESLTSEFTNLLPYTVYAVTGSSFNQNGDRSSWSNIERARTDVGVPHEPVNLTAVDVTKESVTLEWEEPVPSTGPVEHYIVTWTEGKQPALPRNTSDTSFAFGSLSPFTVYHAQVSAVTSAGQGPPAEIKVKTLLEVPDPPKMKLEGIQNTSISVSWVLSDYYRGPRPTYSLRWRARGGAYATQTLEDPSDEKRYTITGLAPYTVYEVQVRGSNDAGVGRWSEAQDAQTDVGAPSVPRNLRAQSTFAKNVTVEWDEPDPPNGPVSQIRYQVAWRTKPETSKTSYTQETRFQATDLEPYTDYDFKVQAESGALTSSWTRILQVKTGIDIPSAPLNLKETGRSNTSIGIHWEAPRRKNGPDVIYFAMWIGNMRAGVSSTAYVNGTDYRIQDLLPYTNYTISVRAKTSAGMGDYSNTILVQTLAGTPSMPKNVRVADVSPTNITLEWQEPTVSGGLLDGYVLHWGIQDTEGSVLRITEDSYQALGLRPYTRYFFKIAAETEGGMGPSVTVYERTAASVPSVPRYVTFTQVTDHCILLKWSPPEQPNGPSLQYTVRWRTVSSESKAQTEQLNDTSYRIKDLRPSTNYSVEVGASTMVGRGPWTETFYIETGQKDYSSAKTAGAVVGSLLLIIAILVAALLLVARKKGGLRNIIPKKKAPATSSETLDTSVSSLPMNVLSDSETVNVRNFDQHVLKLMANGYYKLAQEFEKLGKESPAFPSNEARKSDNLTKNRWVKILPFDHTRVKLLPVGDEVEHDFINASYLPGDSHLLEYIATQGPLSNTVNDFWRMAWQESVFTIVMLTQCVERAKRTCERYWPSAGETQTYGQIEVKCISESITPAYIVRIFLVSQEGKQRHIVHLHYMNWPVSGCPKSPDDFLSFTKTVRGQISCAVTGPMIVHCSAGIGRTGTFIAVDRLCQQIEHGCETVDIYGTVLEMRRHRANMVQTEEQYYFIYLCMQRIVQEKRQELENDYGAGIYSN